MMAVKKELPERKHPRLKNYDYKSGVYFITLCTSNREQILSTLCRVDPCGQPRIKFSELGYICHQTFPLIAERYQVIFDCWIIMPDHIHCVLIIPESRSTARVDPTQRFTIQARTDDYSEPTLFQVMGAYKSIITKQWRDLCNARNVSSGHLWQSSYYEHVIRNTSELYAARKYISDNPNRWCVKYSI